MSDRESADGVVGGGLLTELACLFLGQRVAFAGEFGLPSAPTFGGILVPLFDLFEASDCHRLLLRAGRTEADFPRFVKRGGKSLILLVPVASRSQLDCGIVRFCADLS